MTAVIDIVLSIMTLMERTYINILSLLALMFAGICATTSCKDDLLLDDEGGLIDGSMRDLAVEISFDAENEHELRSRAAARDEAIAGNSIQNIDHLRILIYKADSGVLSEDLTIINNGVAVGGTIGGIVSNVKYTKDADNRLPEEKDEDFQDKASGKVTFNITLPSANYYMYAVANAADITSSQVSDRHKMKNIPRRWEINDISKNSEMFGVFSHAPNRNATDSSPLSITNKMVSLHCWLRRLASKVTVAFDGTGLYDNVQVYIDTIALYDIPQQCLLGNPNTAGRDYGKGLDATAMLPIDAATRYKENSNGLIFHGPYDLVQDLSKVDGNMLLPKSYYHVSNVVPYLGKGETEGRDPSAITKRHGHAEKSLFFYENLQGRGEFSKQQDANHDNLIDRPDWTPNQIGDKNSWKDGKPYGTYVQVHGHYRCTSFDGSVSAGPIVYRFMLGKDTDKDFDAERNTHYKLTLQLKGYGNDADWHIEYEHKRGILVASPQFISYLYNKKMMVSVKVAGKIPANSTLHAEIEEDPNRKGFWMPWGDGINFPKAVGGTNGSGVYWNGEITKGGRHNSFLSLSQTNVISVEQPGWEGVPSTSYDQGAIKIDYHDLNLRYFNGELGGHNKGVRDYSVVPNETGYDSNNVGDRGAYFVSSLSGSGEEVSDRVFSIPLYTRAKDLVARTAYSGNNPYLSYARKQRVRFSIYTNGAENKDFEPTYLDVIQVPRIVNPKGVWRSEGNNEYFHVALMQLGEDEKTFSKFTSIGKWSAEVVTGPNAPIITLSTTDAGIGQGNKPQSNVSRIEGESECPIDFNINFNGNKGFAIVKVRYHNYSCEHDIFVRKGYQEPVDVVGNGQRWSSFNIHHFENGKAVPTVSPLQEGSLFKRGNNIAILAKNNHTYGWGVNPGDNKFEIIDEKGNAGLKSWSQISTLVPMEKINNLDVSTWTITNPGEHIATAADFYTFIASSANDINFSIKQAYGVLYGDGATEVAETTDEAFGYDDENGGPSSKGMRGTFVYNSKTCKQIFLPIGFAGHGHRKISGGWRNDDKDGTLRYAGRSAAFVDAAIKDMPLFYDLYRRPGAIYWTKYYYPEMPTKSITVTTDGGSTETKEFPDSKFSSSFDINYFTFGFEGYSNNAVRKSDGLPTVSHGCFIRTVYGDEVSGSVK